MKYLTAGLFAVDSLCLEAVSGTEGVAEDCAALIGMLSSFSCYFIIDISFQDNALNRT